MSCGVVTLVSQITREICSEFLHGFIQILIFGTSVSIMYQRGSNEIYCHTLLVQLLMFYSFV